MFHLFSGFLHQLFLQGLFSPWLDFVLSFGKLISADQFMEAQNAIEISSAVMVSIKPQMVK